jgi:hypothetical protein
MAFTLHSLDIAVFERKGALVGRTAPKTTHSGLPR